MSVVIFYKKGINARNIKVKRNSKMYPIHPDNDYSNRNLKSLNDRSNTYQNEREIRDHNYKSIFRGWGKVFL